MEDSLAQIAGKGKSILPARSQRGEKSQLSDADILGFVYHNKIERRLIPPGNMSGKPIEHS